MNSFSTRPQVGVSSMRGPELDRNHGRVNFGARTYLFVRHQLIRAVTKVLAPKPGTSLRAERSCRHWSDERESRLPSLS